ncbi:hypothetical protein Dsin_017784 [Dipteronia sinensis]|uniref:Uncharacterized protein n=1 Tax=Dipteronia sinensis TaxID=43782 RepID=A0AAE0AGB0_9ROSI|nr:hypothetical protein Dsin_017784 [Dipteronia sinensis]
MVLSSSQHLVTGLCTHPQNQNVSNSVKFSIALILACVFMVIAPCSAVEPSTEFTTLFRKDPDVLKCLSTLQSVQGCVQEIIPHSGATKFN